MLLRLFGALCVIAGFCWADKHITGPDGNPKWNATYTDLLRRDLLTKYDKFARPADTNSTTHVEIGLTIRHIEVDEDKSVISVHGWLKMKWNDDKLKWNESDYGGLDNLHVAEHEVWQPDVVLYNTAGSNIDHYGQTNLIIYTNGQVLWVPPATFSAFCELDLTLWPYDKQRCSLVLGSWTYHGYALALNKDEKEPHTIELSVENSEWKILTVESSRHDKTYACCPEPYPDVTYTIEIQRRSPTYKAVIVGPASVIVLMILAGFWLPATSGEKIFLNGIVAVMITLYLLYFSHKLPVMAFHVPLIVLFYSTSLFMVCFSVIISVAVLNLSRTKRIVAVPWLIRKLIHGPVGKLLLLNGQARCTKESPMGLTSEEGAEEEHPDDGGRFAADNRQIVADRDQGRGGYQQDWIVLATAVDRLAFIVYALVFIVVAIVYSV